MTRENKLALVVGFGLVLFVGILISDHYSEARRAESADLHDAVELARGSGYAESKLLDAMPERPKPIVAARSGQAELPDLPKPNWPEDRAVTPPGENTSGGPRTIRMGEPVPPTLIPEGFVPDDGARRGSAGSSGGTSPGNTPAEREYRMRSGETLFGIAQREYGNGSLWARLAEYNGIADAERLVEGTRLRLPDPSYFGLAPGAGSSSPQRLPDAAPARPSPGMLATYTVEDGDTLAKIARKVLGSRARWPEIHKLNQDRLKNPDHVVPGMVIRVPAAG